jgi:hypothetical protein
MAINRTNRVPPRLNEREAYLMAPAIEDLPEEGGRRRGGAPRSLPLAPLILLLLAAAGCDFSTYHASPPPSGNGTARVVVKWRSVCRDAEKVWLDGNAICGNVTPFDGNPDCPTEDAANTFTTFVAAGPHTLKVNSCRAVGRSNVFRINARAGFRYNCDFETGHCDEVSVEPDPPRHEFQQPVGLPESRVDAPNVGCPKDTDCKGERICQNGSCVAP